MYVQVKDTISVNCSTYANDSGCAEYYLVCKSCDELTFEEALDDLYDAYIESIEDIGLDETTLQFTRIYVSDISNEYGRLRSSRIYKYLCNGAVSVVEQSPVFGPVSMLSYHMKSEFSFLNKTRSTSHNGSVLLTEGLNYRMLWKAGSISEGNNSAVQTSGIFSSLDTLLNRSRMSVRENTVRTWLYVRDVDNNYKGMVDSRKDYFSKIGLTDKTRYIASTGIEGKMADTKTLVTMDSLSIGNISESQIVRMEALSHMSSTIQYGVTFERGTQIRFGDRSHLHISGTASIDSTGAVVHEYDIRLQTLRTIDNIEALLSKHNASLDCMMYLLVYLRNRKHYQCIGDILTSRIPQHVHCIPVEGAVCRPGWLIEIEGVGIIDDSTEFPALL
ncbi:MAG: Rid family hydrolase [Fibrobacterota bacterium]|nr:Rid family hydrolase [Chitinispirillaceae bacterium]